ncbi:MAG: carbohydrate-binding family 9-like protein [Roseiflexaceae bacterium]
MHPVLPTIQLVQSSPDWLVFNATVLDADWRSVSVQCILMNALTGTPQRYATTVRFIATPTHLWLRFDCADADVWATLTEHDTPLYTEEVVELFIAPGSATPIKYYELQTNPLNAQFDGIIHNPDEHRSTMSLDLSWDPQWQSWSRVDAAGWVSVWSLPWAMFGQNDGIGTWRCNVYRIDRPRNGDQMETSAWSPTLRDPVDFHIPSRFGVLTITER